MNRIFLSFSVVLGLSLFIGCENKIGKIAPKAPTALVCDSVKYTAHIRPIILKNCAISGCHVTGFSSGDFTTYADLNGKIVNGKFKARVIDANPGPMPAAGKLPQEQLDSIQCWLNRGAPND